MKKLHFEAHKEYVKTVDFLNENQTNLDLETYNAAVNLNDKIGRKFIELSVYIQEVKKIEMKEKTQYNPELANRELPREVDELVRQMDDFASLIKEKEKFKIFNQN